MVVVTRIDAEFCCDLNWLGDLSTSLIPDGFIAEIRFVKKKTTGNSFLMPPPFKGAPGVTILVLLRAIVPRAITIYDFTLFRFLRFFRSRILLKSCLGNNQIIPRGWGNDPGV